MAQHSGVSVSTASRALSGSPRVSGQTVARVRAAAAALGYRPNASARTLRTAVLVVLQGLQRTVVTADTESAWASYDVDAATMHRERNAA